MNTQNINNETKNRVNDTITEAEGIKVGDKVKHVLSDEVATVTAIRKAYWDASDGEVWLFTLDFGKDTKGEWKTVLGPFKMDLNGKEFRREALTLQKNCVISDPDGRELLPEPPKEVVIDEPNIYEKHHITADEIRAHAFHYTKVIRKCAQMACTACSKHGKDRIEVSIAYRNDTKDPNGMSYRVCHFQNETLKDCVNGVSLDQAARMMADFYLLSGAGVSLDVILYGEAA